MTSNRITMGIDYRSGRYYTARVRQEASERKVTALVTATESELKEHQALEGEDIIFSVPDNEVVVKNLRLSQADKWNTDLLARFELSQSLLDDENEFCFATLSIGQPNRCLGLVTRRRNLEQLTGSLLSSLNPAALLPKYEMRAIALGKGYLNFCHPEQGELVCLADFGDNVASICFMSGGNIIGLAHLPRGQFDLSGPALTGLNSEPGLKKMAVEFKTVVNFELPSLFKEGVAPPLSALIVSGDGSDSPVKSALGQHFQVPVTAPRIDKRFLQKEPAVVEGTLEDYLVAMGLTVN
ncbi:MAG: hypothetical protein E3J26_05910 [Candidatus Zixiibacteriota bacterium]|nr:MAG: hypothetical protein E3J26_05910 [candidate division Zixibacteria bacterium]